MHKVFPSTNGFPSQRASNSESVSICWPPHDCPQRLVVVGYQQCGAVMVWGFYCLIQEINLNRKLLPTFRVPVPLKIFQRNSKFDDNCPHYPDSKVPGANMGPIWGRQGPGGPQEPCYLGILHKTKTNPEPIIIKHIRTALVCSQFCHDQIDIRENINIFLPNLQLNWNFIMAKGTNSLTIFTCPVQFCQSWCLVMIQFKGPIQYKDAILPYGIPNMNIWGLCPQKQVSQAGISNCIPQYSVACNYLSMPEIPASGGKVLIWRSQMQGLIQYINSLRPSDANMCLKTNHHWFR